MTSTTTATSTVSTAPTLSTLRSLHLVRAVFSAIWVALVGLTSVSLVAVDKPSAVAAVLLVVYPLWDVAATVAERRLAPTSASNRVSTVNLALGLAATIAMAVAVRHTIGTALLVFGVWAFFSGAVQLAVALLRRRTVGAQWPMVVSGGLSVLAGVAFVAMSASATTGLSAVAGYSAFGAFWFLVSAVTLTRRIRRSQA